MTKQELKSIEKAYTELLKIDHISTRIELQSTYCKLRDLISTRTGIDERIVQEAHEQLAIKEKYDLT